MKSGPDPFAITCAPRASSASWTVLSLSLLPHLRIIVSGVLLTSTLVAWIFNTIDSSIRSTIIIPDDAKILWDDLRDRYSLGNGPRILEIKNAIADCKQRGRSVAIYYGELNKLQNLLSSYLKLPACTCSAAAEYARMHETAMLHQFCIGLDSQKFGSVVSTLLMSDPLPTMNAAYAKIIADERKQSVSAAQEATSATSVGFSATGSASGRSSDRLECSHCKRVGHDKDHCYSLHGFPDGGRGGRSGRGGRGGRGGRSTGKGRGDFAGSVGSTARGANEQVSDSDRGSVPTLSDTQWKELLAALKGSKSGSASDNTKLGPQFEEPDWSGEQCDGVYIFRPVRARNLQAHRVVVSDASLLWHRRLGHPSMQVVCSLPGVTSSHHSTSGSSCLFDCDICFMGKQPRNSFPLSSNKASDIFDLIHCDIWGPNKIASSCDARYFLTIVDDFSRATWVFLMVGKYDTAPLIREFCAMVETQFHRTVKVVRSDNGQEFLGLGSFFAAKGVLHQTSCVDTAQQNGRVERKHRHILNVARALRFQAKLPKYFWGECVLSAVYLINKTPTPLLHGKTPYECLFGQAPSYANIRIFGCLCYAANRPRVKDKFDSRSRKCIFVGYPNGKKGWRLFDLETNEFFVSRDVQFFEDKFPYLNSLPDEKRALWEAYFASPPVWEDANDDDTPPTA
ncbi:uncharacterized protein LOC130591897, partial [Beta vulgaris subsp. vulgaris]|uniref:uncharacterized protein LOC130591897 n=1 Tax=Beta vulgaris subsp. vulgaris TaxID=3555 RepID=UPI002547A35E